MHERYYHFESVFYFKKRIYSKVPITSQRIYKKHSTSDDQDVNGTRAHDIQDKPAFLASGVII